MPEEFQYIIKAPKPAAEIFTSYQLAHEFYRESQYRHKFELHCQWYRSTAENHRDELRKMQGDINLLSWFRRRKR